MISNCIQCGKLKKVAGDGRTKGVCKVCYKKFIWKPKLKTCKRCKRDRPLHAKGFCPGCYSSTNHLDAIKVSNTRKLYALDYGTYKLITKACVICGFDKIVDLHHLDHNKKNNSSNNLVGICPNHHKMIHHTLYQKEIYQELRAKGFGIPELSGSPEFRYKTRIIR